MTVDEICEKLIRDWPTLYKSRANALRKIFTSGAGTVEWIDGSVHYSFTEPERDRLAGGVPQPKEGEKIDDLLSRRREYAEVAFVIENAALLAREHYSEFEFAPSFERDELARIPVETLTPEWRAALEEYCLLISIFDIERFICKMRGHYGVNYQADHWVKGAERAKITANAALLRLNPKNKSARQMKIEQLRKDAAALGFDLVEHTN